MKRVLFSLLVALCLVLIAVPARAAQKTSDAHWYIDEETKTLYINGQGTTADANPEGWKANFKIEHVVIGEGITAVSDGAFVGCLYLKTVQLPSSIKQIGNSAFSGTSLTQIQIPNGVVSIGERGFEGCTGLRQIELPGSVSTIGNHAFEKCTKLEKVILNEGIAEIGRYAFYECAALKAIEIPGSVQQIGDRMFWDCTALEEVVFGEGVTSAPSGIFQGCTALRNVRIPDSVEELDTHFLSFFYALETVEIGSGLKELPELAFYRSENLKQIEISPDNPYLTSVDGVVYSKDMTTLLKIPTGFEGTYEVLPGTLCIGERAGYGCDQLTGLVLPASVTLIDGYAFDDCKGIETLRLNEGLILMGQFAFSGCEGLTELIIPSTVEEIGSNAFSHCTGLERIEFLGDLPIIGRVFSSFSHVEADAYHPEGNVTWENGRLDYGGNLDWPQDPEYDKYSGTCEETDAVWRLDPESGVLTISGQGPMGYLSDMRSDLHALINSIAIEEGITEIPHSAFARLVSLTEVKVAASVQEIGAKVFADCDALKRVEILGSEVVMDADIFYDCNALQSVRFSGDAPEFDERTFFGASTVVYYPKGNPSWVQPVQAGLLGEITWIEYDPEQSQNPQPDDEASDSQTAGQLLPWILLAVAVIAGIATVIVILEKRKL